MKKKHLIFAPPPHTHHHSDNYVTKTGRIEDCAKQFAGCVNGQKKNNQWDQRYNITLSHVFQTSNKAIFYASISSGCPIQFEQSKTKKTTLEIVKTRFVILEELNRK